MARTLANTPATNILVATKIQNGATTRAPSISLKNYNNYFLFSAQYLDNAHTPIQKSSKK